MEDSDTKPPLLAQTPEALAKRLSGTGRAREVFRLLREGADPFSEDAELAVGARRRLADRTQPTVNELKATTRSSDGVIKLLVGLRDQRAVETVLIPTERRTTLCISSQVGCARDCDFCLTATMGLVRNLGCDEIVAQVVRGIRISQKEGLPPLKNLVFMGMGEPLDNADAVERSLEIITAHDGLAIGPRHITVSTVGTTERAIARAATWPAQLAWSLHAANPQVRSQLIRTARRTPEQLRDAFVGALESAGRALFVEVVLIDGINDRTEDAEAIARLFEHVGIEIRVNLLPLNGIERPDLRPSPRSRVEAFRERLQASGLFCMIRRSRGSDRRAACGQLAVVQS